MNKNVAIIGAGGHGKVVGEIALLNKYKKIDFFDDNINQIKIYPFNLLGNLKNLEDQIKFYDNFFVAIGDNQKRYDLINWLKSKNLNIDTLVHPKATVSKFSCLGKGTCVMANAVVNPGSLINEGVIINTSASIDHDCTIEEFAHISPNCSISGSVSVGKLTHIGTGTTIHPGVKIGKNVKIGIGSKIYKDILDNKIVKD